MRRPIWNAIERKLDDYSLRKKFYIFYVLCVMLPLIVTDAVVLSIVENAEKESSRHEMSSIASAVGYNLNSMVNNAEEAEYLHQQAHRRFYIKGIHKLC